MGIRKRANILDLITEAELYNQKSAGCEVNHGGVNLMNDEKEKTVSGELKKWVDKVVRKQLPIEGVPGDIRDEVRAGVKEYSVKLAKIKSSSGYSTFNDYADEKYPIERMKPERNDYDPNTSKKQMPTKQAATEPFSGNVDKQMSDRELERALRLDISAEQDAVNLYGSHADATTNEEIKKTLEDIADEEKKHIGELESCLAKITDDEDKRAEGEEEQEKLTDTEDTEDDEEKEDTEDTEDDEDIFEKQSFAPITLEYLLKHAMDMPGNYKGDGNPDATSSPNSPGAYNYDTILPEESITSNNDINGKSRSVKKHIRVKE